MRRKSKKVIHLANISWNGQPQGRGVNSFLPQMDRVLNKTFWYNIQRGKGSPKQAIVYRVSF